MPTLNEMWEIKNKLFIGRIDYSIALDFKKTDKAITRLEIEKRNF